MYIEKTSLDGVLVITPSLFSDERGWLYESFNLKNFSENIISDIRFVQDNHSLSCKGVLRGLHYQKLNPQGKLLNVLSGNIFDVVVDVRRSSSSYGKWLGLEVSSANRKQLWIPPGLAHGFLVMSEVAEVQYKLTNYFDPLDEVCLAWNDPSVGIQWPLPAGVMPNINTKDAAGLSWDAIPKF